MSVGLIGSKRLAKKILLIGWDGADWQMILPLVEQGKMPMLKGLLERMPATPVEAVAINETNANPVKEMGKTIFAKAWESVTPEILKYYLDGG